MADMGAWYYAAGGGQKGPVSVEQMRALVSAGAVDGETLVWSQGMTDWMPLARTTLASLLRTEPPAPPPPPMPPRGQGWPGAAPAPQPAPQPAPHPAPQPAPTWGAPGGYGAPPADAAPIGMGAAVSACFSKYATFSGRARRAEFWYFYLFMMLVHVVLSIVGYGTMGEPNEFAILSGIAALVFLLPMLSVTVRRLHDTDRSGWWYWIALVPLVGAILLIVFLAERGTPGANRFGPPTV